MSSSHSNGLFFMSLHSMRLRATVISENHRSGFGWCRVHKRPKPQRPQRSTDSQRCFYPTVFCRLKVALDRAAHLMDAVAFGHKDWDGVREELAEVRVCVCMYVMTDAGVATSTLVLVV